MLGCLFSYAGLKGIVTLIPDGMIPREVKIQLNVPVLLFSLGMAIVTSLLFGLAPALQTARQNLVDPLKDSGKGISGGFRRGRLRNALVVAEVALSLVLLAGAGLMMRSFLALQQVDLGFKPHNILFTRLPLPKGQYKTKVEKQRFFRQLLARLRCQRFGGNHYRSPFSGIRSEIDIPGRSHFEKWTASLCGERHFPIGLKVLRGRLLSEVDVCDGRRGRDQSDVGDSLLRRRRPAGQYQIKMLESLPEGKVEKPSSGDRGGQRHRESGIQDPPLPVTSLHRDWAFDW